MLRRLFVNQTQHLIVMGDAAMTHPNQQPGPPTWPDQQPYQPLNFPGSAPPPPPRKSVGRRVAIAVTGALAATLAITGFAAPGFFLHHDEPRAAAVLPPASTSEPTTTAAAKTTIRMGSPEQLAEAKKLVQQFVDALNHDDAKAAGQLACPESSSILGGQLLVAVAPPTSLTITDDPPSLQGGGYIGVKVTGTTHQRDITGDILVWQPIARPTLCVRRLGWKW
ncbi:hypothetical protein ABJI51_16670 [Amycolatopsis sp. NEAU-NG30]|uniref:Uncharacterized protein n=1 Tax=Amycolatopsis melonis TaxID=3156488 RepID=A0ABV0LH90_9PSEU